MFKALTFFFSLLLCPLQILCSFLGILCYCVCSGAAQMAVKPVNDDASPFFPFFYFLFVIKLNETIKSTVWFFLLNSEYILTELTTEYTVGYFFH